MSFSKEDRAEINKVGWFSIGWLVIIVLVVLAVGAGIWALTVALSGPKGQGDAVVEKNSSENWTAAQAEFEENFAEYEATLVRIDTAYSAHIADPGDKTLEQTYLGTIGYCTNIVSDYNAASRSYLSEDFKSADLPEKLDPKDCAPSASLTR